MKLIIVDRNKVETFNRLRQKFADQPDVKVILERRKNRPGDESKGGERRRLRKPFGSRDYIVVYLSDDGSDGARPPRK
jgi:hypothetical protein